MTKCVCFQTAAFKLGNGTSSRVLNILIKEVFSFFLPLFEHHTVGELLWGYTPGIIAKWNKVVETFHHPELKVDVLVGIYTGVSCYSFYLCIHDEIRLLLFYGD